jgi:hypothetical protein
MPVQDLSVMNYGRGENNHRWEVADTSMREVGTPSRRMESWDVWFKRFSDIGAAFLCDCTKATSIAPGGRVPICDHILAVGLHITRVKGAWEEDRVLMEKAWELISEKKWYKPNFTVKRDETSPYGDESFLVYQPGIGGVRVDTEISNMGVSYSCPCVGNTKKICDHVQAVMEFKKNEPVIPPKRIERVYVWSVGPTAKASKDEQRFMTTKSKFGISAAEMKMDDGLISAITKASETLRRLQKEMPDLVEDEPEKHKKPEEPRKPRSRFSEIDL